MEGTRGTVYPRRVSYQFRHASNSRSSLTGLDGLPKSLSEGVFDWVLYLELPFLSPVFDRDREGPSGYGQDTRRWKIVGS